MDTAILVIVAALVVIGVSSRLGPRWNIASPLILVAVGIGVSFLPFVPDIEVEPEVILAVVLPPLLFSSAVSMPAMNFRREFNVIGGLAVFLVVLSSVLLGFFFHWIMPDLALPWCIALGAILSPTDAVATSIARGVGISSRVSTILEGESLLNDATALVMLRTAIAAAASAFSLWTAVGQFGYSVMVAIVIGFIAGRVGLWARRIVKDPTVSTVLSLVIPFAASVPTDLLHGSGLVAAVVAGVVIGRHKDRAFDAQQRISDRNIWQAVTLVLEGGVFLMMGLEIRGLINHHTEEHGSVASLWQIVLVALAALALMLIIRTAFVLPLVRKMGRKATRAQEKRAPQLDAMESAIADRDFRRVAELCSGEQQSVEKRIKRRLKRGLHPRAAQDFHGPSVEAEEKRWAQLDRRTRMVRSDIDHYTKTPLNLRDGLVMVASGMRGAVTLAAAQTLPLDTPNRSSLVLIAFAVAVLSLGIQGSLLAPLVRWIKPTVPDPEELRRQAQALQEALEEVTMEQEPGESMMDTKLRVITARREILLDLQDEGYYDPETIGGIMASMDAIELGVRLRQSQVHFSAMDSRTATTQELASESAAEADSDRAAAVPLVAERRAVLAQAEEATRLAADGVLAERDAVAVGYQSDDALDREMAVLSADQVASAIAAEGTGGSDGAVGAAGGSS